MSIVKKTVNNLDWIFKSRDQNKAKMIAKKQKGVNNHKKESRRLKYCESCERVWEIGYTGSVHSYGHLPTYKLPRKTCRICKGIEDGQRGWLHNRRAKNNER